ncbi:MAG: UDP-N-acetylmuramoyl-L-alanyl-D-glutamate--2,6-diaminopimelate ligase [Rubrivivax sp.]|nr:UDP-N-acetylmuramoyl-L-alanyl-D-glutamate--2,6-diaminopimelate ligase [Rubrivivax sp.]
MTALLATPQAAADWLRARVAGTLASDSRALRAGDGFVAWPGRQHDARRFVPQALAAGAAACLVEADGLPALALGDDERIAALAGLKAAAGTVADRFFGQPSRALQVVATTGTNGKTSTAWWTAQALTALGRRCGVVGTLGIGEPPAGGGEAALSDSGLTTPDALALHAALRGFADRGLGACAIEASSIGLVEHRLDGLKIDVALFTNLTRDHLDYHGDMAAYGAAKRRLFDWPGLRAAVVNVADGFGAALADGLRGSAVDLWTVSLDGAARLTLRDLRETGAGMDFEAVETVDGGSISAPVRARVVGRFNAGNLLLVLGALRALGVPLADAAAALAAATPVPGRLQPLAGRDPEGGVEVVVDYAHTPDALQQVLAALRPRAAARGGRLWCVFGCGGDRDASKRPLMGAIAARHADRVVLTSDNPRSEPPGAIVAQILAGVAGHDEVDVIVDRHEAIAFAVANAAAGDLVLVAGKGHEPYQEIAGVKRPFSDPDEVRAALAARDARPQEGRA